MMANSSSNVIVELIVWEQFREGNKDALASLFELTSDRLYRYGTKFVLDEELVKDSIQELFIKLHQNQNTLPKLDNPIFYLFKSLKNLLINTINQREKTVCISQQELPFYVNFVFEEEADQTYDDDVKEKFAKVINLLSDRQKEAIVLRYQEEMSYEEISALLGINYQSARNLIHRSIEKIRSEMDLSLFMALFLSLLK